MMGSRTTRRYAWRPSAPSGRVPRCTNSEGRPSRAVVIGQRSDGGKYLDVSLNSIHTDPLSVPFKKVYILNCRYHHRMKTLHISRGGQISLPSDIRHRWGSSELLLEDHGDAVILRPMPADPIAAARGALGPPRVPLDEAREQERLKDAEREEQRVNTADG